MFPSNLLIVQRLCKAIELDDPRVDYAVPAQPYNQTYLFASMHQLGAGQTASVATV